MGLALLLAVSSSRRIASGGGGGGDGGGRQLALRLACLARRFRSLQVHLVTMRAPQVRSDARARCQKPGLRPQRCAHKLATL